MNSSMFVIIPLISFGVLLNAIAQLLLKAGTNKIGYFSFNMESLIPISMQVASNPYIITGLAIYAVSVVLWILVLSRIDVSLAYPMVSLGYVVNAVAAYYIFGEDISITRIMGIGVILFGVFLISRTA